MSNPKKKLKASKYAYNPHTHMTRTCLLVGMAIEEFILNNPGTSDSSDLAIIGRVMFRDGYLMARSTRRVHALYLSKHKKGGGK